MEITNMFINFVFTVRCMILKSTFLSVGNQNVFSLSQTGSFIKHPVFSGGVVLMEF